MGTTMIGSSTHFKRFNIYGVEVVSVADISPATGCGLLMFYTGMTRDAGEILQEQCRGILDERAKEQAMHMLVESPPPPRASVGLLQ